MFDAGNFAAAERLAREAVAADPKAAAAHTLLAQALVRQGRTKDGLAVAKAALALAPDSSDAFHAQGMALRALGRFPEAVVAAGDATRLDPDCAVHANLLGLALEEAGRVAEAGEALRRAMSLAPDGAFFRASYGLFLLRHRGRAEAERVALELDPASDHTEALLFRGKLALLRCQPVEARDFARWILSRDAAHRRAIRLLVEAEAEQRLSLRPYRRIRVLVDTGPKWASFVIVIVVLSMLLVPGLNFVIVTLLLYMKLARKTFNSRLTYELRAIGMEVQLKERF